MLHWRDSPTTTLVATSLAAFTAALDNTVVAVALRDMQEDLGSSVLGLQGVVTAYTLVLAALLLAAGGLVDRLGARRVTALGLVVFGAASAGCAAAADVTSLIAWRAAQGVGAALLLPAGLALLAAAYPDPQRRRRAVAVWGALTGVALVAGPVVGGELVARDGWPTVFWVNVPLCAVCLALLPLASSPRPSSASAGSRADPTSADARFDATGALLTCAALGAVTYAVVLAGRDGLSGEVGLALAAAGVAGAALRVVEQRADPPLLPPDLLRARRFRGAVLAAFGAALAVFVLMVFLSLFLQLVQEEDARGAGGVLLALPVALVAAALVSSRWRAVAAPVGTGLVLAGAGLLGLALVLDEDTSHRTVEVWLLVVGAGCGLTTAPVVSATLQATGEARAGLASASVTVARELGGVVAVAGLGALAVARLTDRLTATMVAAGVPGEARGPMLDALLSADRTAVRRQLVEAVGAERALRAYGAFVRGATESFVASTTWVLGTAGVVLILLGALSAHLLRAE